MAKGSVFPIDESYISLNLKYIAALVKCIADLLQTLDARTLPEFTQAFASVVVHVAGAFKTFSIVYSRAEILLLARLFNWERHLSCTPQMAHFRDVLMSKASASSRKLTLIISGIVLMNSFADLYSTLTVANCTLTDYPLSYLPLKEFSSAENCRTVALADYIVHNFASANIIINDSFLMAVMSYITVQLKILNFRLSNCHKTFIEELIIPEDEKNLEITSYECHQMSKDVSVLDPNRELIKCIENHQKMTEIFTTFKSIYNNILLPQLLSSLLILSLMGCQLVLTNYDTDEDVHAMVHPLIFVTWATLELYIYCAGGNSILIESEQISSSAYNTQWYNNDKQFRGNLALFLSLVERPLVISIGGVIALSKDTFKNILTKAYSFMAILKNSSGQ
ncbi:uncharacterized protein LOC107037131 [Diachasma alloeum]|uniref:Odorant receptor n=1 Tax=Diachasma alloeum TaxID=454923 RepID=A0A4E0RLH9_9HYME|nr:uncharacterized protein LOC107037131 [Diachasma alloeum]THK32989.1 odorant receptor 122 [Diachasma alloeum]